VCIPARRVDFYASSGDLQSPLAVAEGESLDIQGVPDMRRRSLCGPADTWR
jgi:hypothetical protein